MTQYQLVTAGKEKLNEHNVPDADIDAELLWLFVSKQDKMAYIMNRQEDVTETIRSSYEALIDKRSKTETYISTKATLRNRHTVLYGV